MSPANANPVAASGAHGRVIARWAALAVLAAALMTVVFTRNALRAARAARPTIDPLARPVRVIPAASSNPAGSRQSQLEAPASAGAAKDRYPVAPDIIEPLSLGLPVGFATSPPVQQVGFESTAPGPVDARVGVSTLNGGRRFESSLTPVHEGPEGWLVQTATRLRALVSPARSVAFYAPPSEFMPTPILGASKPASIGFGLGWRWSF